MTSSHLVDKHFISQNNYNLLNASRYLERIPALTTELHADFNMWTFKGYGYMAVISWKWMQFHTECNIITVYLINYASHLILKSNKIFNILYKCCSSEVTDTET